MRDSHVPWDVRYRYFTKGWVNNWGWGPVDGYWGLAYFTECDAQGRVPAVAYYQMNDEPGGGEGQFYAKTQNASTMQSYFSDFRTLMQRAKDFGKPVVVLVEADGFAYLEQQTSGNPSAYAAVQATGLPELQNLPNTVAGWGLAFLRLRQSVGADNVILGIHVSGWATGKDLFFGSVTEPLQAHVDAAYDFLAPLGLAANVTGKTYDVLVGDPLDRDANYYQLVRGENRWWDPSDTASIASQSFNRYAEWLRLWNLKANKRWVLWQVPVGNSASLDVCNTGGARQGYKDNRTEYFFGSAGGPHRQLFANNGVLALLFGAGEGCQSSFEVDNDASGQPYLLNHAGAFLTAGGLAIPRSSGGAADAGAPVTGTPDAGAGPVGDPATYNFERGLQGFQTAARLATTLTASGLKPFQGNRSLAIAFHGAAAGTEQVLVPSPQVPAGSTITFHVFFPAGSALGSLQVFAQEDASASWRWTGRWVPTSRLTAGAWNTVSITLPAKAAPLQSLGIELTTTSAWTGTVWVDSIDWGSGAAAYDAGTPVPVVDAGTPVPVVDAGTPMPVVDAGTPAPVVQGCLSILPLGDSITLGVNGGYRNELYTSLRQAACGVNYVGSQYDPYTHVIDKQHEGHPGFTIGDISSNVDGWLAAYQPNVVLLAIGTNDIAWWSAKNAQQIGAEHSALVDKIRADRPNAWIIVASIPPITSQTIAPNNVDRAQLARDLNTVIQANTLARAQAGQRVRFADVASVLTVSDLYDGVHPTEAAHAKVAHAFFQALVPVVSCAGTVTCGP